jgi:hypothetical protein
MKAKTKTAKQKVEDNAKKVVKDNGVNESKAPILSHKQVQVISLLSKAAPYTIVSLCSMANGASVVSDTMKNTFAKTVMTPLEKAGIVLPNKQAKPFTYTLNEKATSASHELPKLLDALPTTVPTSITVGFLGGMVFGKEQTPNGKRDLWVNVRFGRATAAILKRLVACGAVGVHQQAPGKPKHYYRNPAK